tara:strand:- start:2584 stop:2706 length:123 start_codon:yes stop_codon:yes gene_type:complete
MQVDIKKEQKNLKVAQALKNNLKKRKLFQTKIKKKVKNKK